MSDRTERMLDNKEYHASGMSNRIKSAKPTQRTEDPRSTTPKPYETLASPRAEKENLIRAGAFIAAEIDRLSRLEAK